MNNLDGTYMTKLEEVWEADAWTIKYMHINCQINISEVCGLLAQLRLEYMRKYGDLNYD